MIHRVVRLLEGDAKEKNSDIYSVELILEMLEVTIAQGMSLPRSLVIVGTVIEGPIGLVLSDIGHGLSEGQEWNRVWKPYLNRHERKKLRRGKRVLQSTSSTRYDHDRSAQSMTYSAKCVLTVIHNVLEPAYKRGVSPILRIENAIEQFSNEEKRATLEASHELSVRILLPLGLCFLPGFIVLTVVPLISSFIG